METATLRSVLVYSENATCKMVRLELSMAECAQADCLEQKTALYSPRSFGREELG
jgi:hypothetical protein